MAKMRIFEIARSIQAKNKEIKSGDLVKLLNENGFDVKGANSNIEDKEIAFLLQTFNDPKKVEKILASHNTEDVKEEEKESEKKEPVKEQKTAEPVKEKTEEKKLEEKQAEEPVKKPVPEEKKKEENKKKVPEREPKKEMPEKKNGNNQSNSNSNDRRRDNNRDNNNRGGNDHRNNRNNNNRDKNRGGNNDRNANNRGDRRPNNNNRNANNRSDRNNDRNANNRGDRNNDRNANNRGDRRPNNNDYRGGNNNRGNNNGRGGNNNRNGEKVLERFEKAQSGFDGIKQEQKNSRKRNKKPADKGTYKKSTKEEMSRIRSKKDPNRKGAFIKPEPVVKEPEETIKQITIPESLTIRELADKMKMPAAALVKKLFLQGQVVSLNQDITFEEAEEIALEFDIIAEKEEKVDMVAELLKEDEEDEADLVKRPPVVCVMGHVDHGKTSLLDAIREANVTSHEAGGITQHIGAYVVEINGEKITFLDTPGHEAFTSMRMRGAQSTDIAILVVAADDGVMPQTVEAINHAKAAGIEIVVAINKIDKPSANIDRVKQELTEYELIPEDWGGSTICVPVSAHTGEGIKELLEMVLLTAEVMELKANPNRRARGLVIEAELDKGKGPVATVLVQKGTLRVGDPIAAGSAYGKVRAMMDDQGRRVKEAGPSMPVEILGLNDVPNAGEVFVGCKNDKDARSFAETFISQNKIKKLEETKSKMSLDDLFNQIQEGNLKELGIVVKADVQGSVEAIKQSLVKLSNEEVVVKIIHGGVGAINESDVTLAAASNAIIIGFNVRPDATAKETAEREGVDVRLYRVIYNAIEDVEAAMKGMLEPVFEEKVLGHAEVRQTFKASGVGTIAGSYVLDGTFERDCQARIVRDGVVIYDGKLASLKRFKDDVKEVKAGYECGFVFERFNDVKEGDQVEAFKMVEVPR